MEKYGAKPVYADSHAGALVGDLIGYKCDFEGQPVYIIGRYNLPSGGCDNISTVGEIFDRVRKFAGKGHVIFEGMLLSGTYGPIHRLSQEFKKQGLGGIVFAPLDTTYEQAIKNIYARSGGTPHGIKNVEKKHKSVISSRKRAIEDGEHVVDIKYKKPLTTLCKILRGEL